MSSDKRTDGPKGPSNSDLSEQIQEGFAETHEQIHRAQWGKADRPKDGWVRVKNFVRDMMPVVAGVTVVLTGGAILGGWKRRRAAKKLAAQQAEMLPAADE